MASFLSTPYPFLLSCLFLLSSPALCFSVEMFSHSGEVSYSFIVAERRLLVEYSSSTLELVKENSSLILAASRTYRKDPLKAFHPYTGGWNISNVHYWASVGFTAAQIFAAAGIWFALFGVTVFFVVCCYCCFPNRRRGFPYSKATYCLSLFFLIVFTIAVLVGSVVLYNGQGDFHRSTTSTLKYVVGQANLTVSNLNNLSNYLSSAKRTVINSLYLPADEQAKIGAIERKLGSTANDLAYHTKKNSQDIQNMLDSVGLDLIIVAAVMLVLAFMGLIFSILGWQSLVYVLVFIGWLLVTGTLILCGVFFILNNAVSDTCVAMDEWVRHPTAKTALDRILPCVDVATANESLYQSRKITSDMVDVVNMFVLNFTNHDAQPPLVPPLYYNQSGPLVPIICNPFTPDLQRRQCKSGEVDFDNAAQVWKGFVCQISRSGICTTVGRITPDSYAQMVGVVNVSYALYHYVPFLLQLEDCTFVRDTFANITKRECPVLQKYSRWVYIGLLMVSVAVMLSLVCWVIYARERRHRKYSKFHPPHVLPPYKAPY